VPALWALRERFSREKNMIDVKLRQSSDPYAFEVRVTERGAETRHRVTMTDATFRKLGGETASPERVVEAAFEFLLDREPKESILGSFDVNVISRYFPEFESDIAGYL
jgi:hypothetical protein